MPSLQAPNLDRAQRVPQSRANLLATAARRGRRGAGSSLSDLREYLNATVGDDEGVLHIAVGSGLYRANGKYKHKHWVPSQFDWPAEADQAERELLASATDSDVYVCPYLMCGHERKRGEAVARAHVHADIDGQLDAEKVRAIDGFAVASGTPGHAHVYVQLPESVPVHWHRALCRGLGDYLGDADAKISDNDVLRPPGTLNYKPTLSGGEPAPVDWLVRPRGVRVDPHTLAHQLGVTLPAQSEPPSTSAAGNVEPIDLDRHPDVKAALDTVTRDRSQDTMRIVGAVHDAHLTLAHARWAASRRADLAGRLDERRDDDVLACWIKVVDSRQAQAWAEPKHGAAAGQEQDEPEVVEGMPRLWRALDLKPGEQARWLAKARLMLAAINLLIGDEGIGKSLLWVWIVAALTTGKPRPEFGIPARGPLPVVIVCTEDHWSTDVRPRLEVAGADLAMIHVICTEDDGSGAPTFPRDLFLLAECDPPPALVVVDAWLDTVPPGLSVRDPQQARQALHPWKEAAAVTGAAMLLVCHTNRVSSANARDRYGATGELRKKARVTVYGQQDDDGNLVVGPKKMNAAAPIPASKFAIKAVQHFPPTDDHDGTVPLLVYVGETEQTAREHLAEAYAADHEGGAGDDAVAWLAAFLAAGPRWAADVYTAAQGAGYTPAKARRAKTRLNVEATRNTNKGPWFWRLPQHRGTPDDVPDSSDDVPDSSDDTVSRHVTPEHLNLYLRVSDNASTSKDVLMMNRETRGHLTSCEEPPVCACSLPMTTPASIARGYCTQCLILREHQEQTK